MVIVMKLLTKLTDYAVRALLCLARHRDGFVSSGAIARECRLPLPFLRQSLRILIRNRIITSHEGIEGGVRLQARPENIYLSDLIRMFQGKIRFSECMFRKKTCFNRNNCAFRKRIRLIEEKVINEFGAISIQTLLNDLKAKKSSRKAMH